MSASEYVEERRKIDLKKVERDTEKLQAKVAEALESGEGWEGWMGRPPEPSEACSPNLAAIWKRYRR